MWTSSGRQLTLAFDPETDDRQAVLAVVDAAYGSAAATTTGPWTAEAMHDYVAALTPAARMVLFAVVTSSPAPRDAARSSTELSERAFERAWVDLQEALRTVPQVGRLPFDEVDGCLVAEDEDAELAARALDRIFDA